MSPSGPRLVYPKADRVISTFSFDPNLSQTHRISIERRPAGHLGRSPERPRHLPGCRLRSSGVPHEGYADPIMNDGPRLYSNVPVSELTELVIRAIEASDVSSAPSVAKTTDGVTHRNSNRPLPSPMGLGGSGCPNTSARPRLHPVPGSSTLTRPIPHCAQRLDL